MADTPRTLLASVHHDGSIRYVQPVGDTDPDRLRYGDEVRLRVRAGLDAPVDRVFLRTAPGRRAGARGAGRGRAGAGLPMVRDRDPADDAGDRLPVPGRRVGGHLVAQRARPPRRHGDRPGRLPAGRRVRPAVVARGPRVLPGVPGPVRERRRRQRRARPRLGLSRPAHPTARLGGPAVRRPGRLGRVLRRRPRRARGPARPPRRPRGQRDLPQPRLRLAIEPRLRHDRLRARRRALRGRRGPRVPAPRDARARHPRDPRHRAQPHRRRAPLVRRRAGRPVGADRRLLHVPLAARRLRVVAGREVAAQARLPRRRAARGDVRGPGRDPAPLARAAVLGRRLAHRRGQHAGPPGPGPARAGGRPRDARRRQGREPRRVPDGRALLRRDRRAQRRPVGRRHELRGVHQPGPRVAERRRAPQRGLRHGRRRRGPDHRRDGRLARRLPRRDPVGGGPLPVRPARQPRHAAGPVRGRRPGRLRAAFGLLFGYVGVPGFLYGDEVGLQGEEGNASRLAMPWNEEALGPRPPRVHPRPRQVPRPVPCPPGRRVPGPRDRRRLARLPARHGRRAGDRDRRARPGVAHGRPPGGDRGDRRRHRVHLAPDR